jgi:ubiquinone/menaquinone biosynthesis C-methylase UbiE
VAAGAELVDDTEASAEEEKRVVTDGLPLAAIFKTRREGKRRAAAGDRSVALANARRTPDGRLETSSSPPPADPPADYDIALTDAFVVDPSDAQFARGTPVIEEADDGLVALTAPPEAPPIERPTRREPLEGLPPGPAGGPPGKPASPPGRPAGPLGGPPPIPASAAAPVAPPPPPAFEDVPEDTIDMDAGEVVPIELLSTADDLHRLRALLPPHADLAWAQEAVLVLAAHDTARFRTPSRGTWYADLFSEEYLLSQPGRGEATITREVAFLRDRLELKRGDYVLDLACGTGRHARAFARQGCQVTALDLSLPMLRRGIEAARREGSEVRFLQADMRDLAFEDAFDAAWMLDTSFGFFSDVENLMVLRSLWRALHPGGRIVIDVINRDYIMSELPCRNWWEGEGCLVQEDIEFAHATSRLDIRRYLVFADGRERVYDISIRIFSAHELVRLMQHAGFEVLDVTGSLHTIGAFFGTGSERILVTARRPR